MMTRTLRLTGIATLLAVVLSGPGLGAAPSATPVLDWLFTGRVSSTTRVGNALYVAGSFDDAGPSSGTLSHLFQLSPVTGAPLAGLPEVNGAVRMIASDGAGGFYVAGPFTNIGSAGLMYPGVPSLMRTAHVLAGGSVDAGFRAQFGGDVLDMLRAGPSLVVAGRLYIDNGTTARALLAVDPVTGALSPWVPALPGTVSAMTTTNGVLFVLTWDGTKARRVSAFDVTTGNLLWTSAVVTTNASLVQGSDAIATVGGRVVVGLDRLYSLDPATGAIDPAWGGPAFAADSWTTAVAVSGSTIYVAGRFTTFHGQPRANLAAVDATTGALLPWSPQATVEFGDMVVSPTGSVFVASAGLGRALRVNGVVRTANLFEIDASGAVTPWESQVQFGISALHVTQGGTLVAGSNFTPLNGAAHREALAAFDATTGALLPNTPTLAKIGSAPPSAFVVSMGATLYLSGTFDSVNGQARTNLAAVDTTTNTILPWPAVGVPSTAAILLAHGGWIYVNPNPADLTAPLRRVDAATGVLDPTWRINRVLGGAATLFVGSGQLYAALLDSNSAPAAAAIGIPDPVTGNVQTLVSVPATNVLRYTDPFAVDGNTLYMVSQALVGADYVGTLRAFDLRTATSVSAPLAVGEVNGVVVADGRVFVNGGSFSTSGGARGGLIEIARPDAVTPWSAGSWALSFRGVTGLAAQGDLLVANGFVFNAGLVRVAGFRLSGATAPSNLRAQEAGANTVFTWDPTAVPPAGGYVIEGGFAAGQTAGALAVGSATSIALPMPAGPVFIRVRPQGSSEVSNEVVAGCVALPPPPTALTTTLNGINLTLAWTAPAGSVIGYTLLAGTASGLSNVASLTLGPQTSVSGPVPGGTFFARVTASNACGTSGPSGEVFFTIGAPDALPAAPTNLTSSVSGSTLTLSWTAPAGPVTGYVLEAGSAPGLANIGAATVGAGTSIVIPGVPAGTYYVRARAVTSAGSGAPSADVAVFVP